MIKLLTQSIQKRRTLKMATKIAAGMVHAAIINQEEHDTDVNLKQIASDAVNLTKNITNQVYGNNN